MSVKEIRDDVRNAVRSAKVKVKIDGKEVILNSAVYNLPVTFNNVQIDCPVTKGYNSNTNEDSWGLEKDARLRLWPAGSPLLLPGSFGYPVKQRIFANDTQMANEPAFVDWGENPLAKKIYYHDGLDIGGAEKADEILSAVDGLIVVANKEVVDGFKDNPILERYRKRYSGRRQDVIFIIDDRGWLYRYSHLSVIDPAVKTGVNVVKGQKIGVLGKEGASGGYTHLHFCIKYELPSGKWATEEAFAYIWNAYVEEYNPAVIALARPYHLIWEGQSVTLDGTKSKSFAGGIVKYEWLFTDGARAFGPVQERSYDLPGTYSEVLKVIDSAGNIDYDYCVVQVRNRKNPEKMPPSIHAVYYPTLNIKPGDPITFGVRTFQTEYGQEVWDFGDGSPKVTVKSEIPKVPEGEKRPYTTKGYDYRRGDYAKTVHSYSKPGHYLVRVERTDENGYPAIAHLGVEVSEPK